MGVLDDAIRQHLELKRAHGADEAELKRKEDEALGPVRREAEPAAEDGWRGGRRAGAGPRSRGRRRRARARARSPPPRSPWPRSPRRSAGGVRRRRPLRRRRAVRRHAGAAPPPRSPSGRASRRPRVSDTPTRGFDALSEEELEDEPFAEEPAPHPPSRPPATPRTCSRRRPSSSRRRRSTTGSGSSRSRRATSTSTTKRSRPQKAETGTARPGDPRLMFRGVPCRYVDGTLRAVVPRVRRAGAGP